MIQSINRVKDPIVSADSIGGFYIFTDVKTPLLSFVSLHVVQFRPCLRDHTLPYAGRFLQVLLPSNYVPWVSFLDVFFTGFFLNLSVGFIRKIFKVSTSFLGSWIGVTGCCYSDWWYPSVLLSSTCCCRLGFCLLCGMYSFSLVLPLTPCFPGTLLRSAPSFLWTARLQFGGLLDPCLSPHNRVLSQLRVPCFFCPLVPVLLQLSSTGLLSSVLLLHLFWYSVKLVRFQDIQEKI